MGRIITDMSRRNFLGAVGKAALVGTVALLPKAKIAQAAMPWHGYSQDYRNSLILTRAWNDYLKNVGLECKPWVQNVVASASGGIVTIPTTNPDNCTWRWSQDVYGYNMSRPIQYAKPGEIVQMRLRNNPYLHTAIVSSMQATKVGFIESNVVPPNGKTVGYREVLFSDFYSGNCIACFSIYTIL